MSSGADFGTVVASVLSRLNDLITAPFDAPDMLWFAIPLLLTSIGMALYAGRYKTEEMSWAAIFANTMVFVFVSLDIIREIYESTVPPSWENITTNPIFFSFSLALLGFGVLSGLIIYFHLVPKRIASALFWNLPVNVSAYVIMTVVYAQVAFDWYTIGAAVILFLIVFGLLRLLQHFQKLFMKHVEKPVVAPIKKITGPEKKGKK